MLTQWFRQKYPLYRIKIAVNGKIRIKLQCFGQKISDGCVVFR